MANTMKIGGYEAQTALESTAQMPDADVFTGILAAPSRMLRAWREIRRHRRAMDELSVLDDRMLQDIGVNRSEIPRVARYGRDIF
jgi:uncharacterized protein YjiS (DUF1127 family)